MSNNSGQMGFSIPAGLLDPGTSFTITTSSGLVLTGVMQGNSQIKLQKSTQPKKAPGNSLLRKIVIPGGPAAAAQKVAFAGQQAPLYHQNIEQNQNITVQDHSASEFSSHSTSLHDISNTLTPTPVAKTQEMENQETVVSFESLTLEQQQQLLKQLEAAQVQISDFWF